ncbi:MAG: MFS transporter [Desulfobacterota bacterium]|nr:MFS transporter [Thermodesulfobacteriota bacterium]
MIGNPDLHGRWWTTLTISTGAFMSTLDASIVGIALPTIVQSLQTDMKTVAWVVMAYLIVISGSLLMMGRLADLCGQGKTFLLGFSVFTLGSALCGLSTHVYLLIGSRIVQGLGASALMAIGPALMTRAFPEKDRGQSLGMLGSVVSLGFVTGPLIGGFLIEHLGWRSIFFINLPVGGIGIFLSANLLKRDGRLGRVELDLWGALLFFLFMTCLLCFLNRVTLGPTPLFWGWAVLSFLFLSLFLLVEHRSSSPLVDLALFKKPLFLSSIGASFLSFWMNGAHNFVLPFFLQDIVGFSPSTVGLMIFPVSLTIMVMAPIGGKLSDWIGVRVPATFGLMVISLMITSFVWLERNVTDLEILCRQVALGIGIGLFNPANNSAIIGSLPRQNVGVASSFLALSRNLGMVIGVAFAEWVVALRSTPAGRGPTLEGIQDVWKAALWIGLLAIFLSWRRKEVEPWKKHVETKEDL